MKRNGRSAVLWILYGAAVLCANLLAALYAVPGDALPWLNAAAGLLAAGALILLLRRSSLWNGAPRSVGLRYYGFCALGCFLGWLPVFLAYWPGLFAYDVVGQLSQVPGRFTTHHPLAHTLYLKLFDKIGRDWLNCPNAGVALSALCQMAVFACMLAFVHWFLARTGVRRGVRLGFLVFTAVCPAVSMLAIALTKDVFFAGFFVMTLTCLACRHAAPEVWNQKWCRALYVCSAAGVVLFRNNGVYCLAAMLAVELLEGLRHRNIRPAAWTAAGLCLGLLLAGGLQAALHAEDGSPNEMLSVPYQQLACVYQEHGDELSEQEKEDLLLLLPHAGNYNPLRSDAIKRTGTGAKHPETLIRLYAKLGMQYPGDYLKAFVRLNAGYLSLTDTTYSRIYGIQNRQGVLLSDTKEDFGVEHTSLLPGLENLYETLFTENRYLDMPGLNLLLSPALYFWLLTALLVGILAQKQTSSYPMAACAAMLILTILAGPCALVRYALPYMLCIPVFAVCVFQKA